MVDLGNDIYIFESTESVGVVSAFSNPRYEVVIAPGLHYQSVMQPNLWYRFWTSVLLGWKWRELD